MSQHTIYSHYILHGRAALRPLLKRFTLGQELGQSQTGAALAGSQIVI